MKQTDPRDHLLPRPKRIQIHSGFLEGDCPLAFNVPTEGRLTEASIRLALKDHVSLRDTPCDTVPPRGLRLIIGAPGSSSDSPEAYQLRVGTQDISVLSRTGEGLLMGLRTLAQLSLEGRIPCCEIADWPDMSLRGAHICYHVVRETLPYNCPDFASLIDHIDRLASVKYNCILLELDSLFPFTRHPAIPCRLAFRPDQIRLLRDRLRDHHMQVIPLVQCLGHTYNVLMHEEYAAYREAPGTCQQFCPTHPGIVDLYLDFVKDYREFFPDLTHWHIGGDESRQMGKCPRCKVKAEQWGISRLYVDHVSQVAQRLHEQGLTPILWSDRLEKYPEDIARLPKCIKVNYWNYDMKGGHRPYGVPLLRQHGLSVIGSPAVRWGDEGTELSVFYKSALAGIEALIGRMNHDGCREFIITNWMKGSPHESADYGLLYGADLLWDTAVTRTDFQRRYAGLTFGLGSPDICAAYEQLSLKLPYAEPVQLHMPDYLNRLDCSGLTFAEKWNRYTRPEEEPTVINQLRFAAAAAAETQDALARLSSGVRRGQRHMDILMLSAQCIRAKAEFCLALHSGRRIQETAGRGIDAPAEWRKEVPHLLEAWRAAKDKHRRLLAQTGFEPVIERLNEMMFEEDEFRFLRAMADTLGDFPK